MLSVEANSRVLRSVLVKPDTAMVTSLEEHYAALITLPSSLVCTPINSMTPLCFLNTLFFSISSSSKIKSVPPPMMHPLQSVMCNSGLQPDRGCRTTPDLPPGSFYSPLFLGVLLREAHKLSGKTWVLCLHSNMRKQVGPQHHCL